MQRDTVKEQRTKCNYLKVMEHPYRIANKQQTALFKKGIKKSTLFIVLATVLGIPNKILRFIFRKFDDHACQTTYIKGLVFAENFTTIINISTFFFVDYRFSTEFGASVN